MPTSPTPTRAQARALAYTLPHLRGQRRSNSDMDLRRRLVGAWSAFLGRSMVATTQFEFVAAWQLREEADRYWTAAVVLSHPRSTRRRRRARVAKRIRRRGGAAHYTVR